MKIVRLTFYLLPKFRILTLEQPLLTSNLSAGQAEMLVVSNAGKVERYVQAAVQRRNSPGVTLNFVDENEGRFGWFMALLYDRQNRILKNTMNFAIKYPRFNKKIRKSQVVT